MKLASFDIFDTTLIRKCGKPETIFYLLGMQLFAENEEKANAFITWRKQAEHEACKKKNTLNIQIGQIYENFEEKSFYINKDDAFLLEKKIEQENLIVNPSIKKLIEQKRRDGYIICFISDTYLDSAFLREILTFYNIIKEQEEIYVSCEWKKRKSTGELFEVVKEKYNPNKWEHYGDNKNSDYKRPQKFGIKSHLINTEYTEAEKYIENKYKYHRFYNSISLFIGIQRATRIVMGNDSFAEIGADFVAPTYIAYVTHILKQAKGRGIKRLYFLNRDGYILLKIAEMLQSDYLDIEMKYLFISRKAIAAASLTQVEPYLLIETLNPQTLIGKKVNDLLSCLQLNPNNLAEKGITFFYNRITNTDEANDFINKLFYNPITSEWEKKIKQDRELIKCYLKQEGVTDGEKSAMVDLGWYGSTRLMLNRILKHYGYSSIPFFYFATTDNVLSLKYGAYFTYMPYRLIKKNGLMHTMEHYCSASPHNSVKSFKKEDNRIIPIEEHLEITQDYLQIIEGNINAAKQILSFMNGIKLDDILDLIQTDYWILMKEQNIKMNLEAFKAVGNISANPNKKEFFVKKMSFTEIMRYALEGKRITEFDRASVSLTCNLYWRKKIFTLHDYSHKLRQFAYLKYMTYKQK
ncbi:MAG: hypothetical protein LBV72_10260 [Tannerella sp.]|jgi:FMN phosphatase YigB (HAD superfamily)|nr:hypothetical protein [Tannerella sp.]